MQTKIVDMNKQSVYTKDNMSLALDTSLFYRIVDPFKATYVVKDVLASIIQLTFVTLRTVCGEYVKTILFSCSNKSWPREKKWMKKLKISFGKNLRSGESMLITFFWRIYIFPISLAPTWVRFPKLKEWWKARSFQQKLT